MTSSRGHTEPPSSADAPKRPASVQQLVSERDWQAIVRLGSAAVDALMAALTDPSVQAEAAEALGTIRHRGALAPLCRLLAADESLVRWSAAEALGRLGDPEAVGPLVAALVDGNQFVREASASALSSLGWTPQDDTSRARAALAARRWEDAIACGTAAAPEALRLLADHDAAIRAQAALVVGAVGGYEALEPLAARLRDTHDAVRRCAAEALGMIADPWAIDRLIESLDDQVPAVREASARALARIGPAAVHPLITAFKRRRTRREVVELLSEIVEAHAAQVADDDLQTLVALRDVDKVVVSGSPGGQGGSTAGWGVRYLSIRQTAKRELGRRGSQAA